MQRDDDKGIDIIDILKVLWNDMPHRVKRNFTFWRPAIIVMSLVGLILLLWVILGKYFAPETVAEKKELIQAMTLIIGGTIAFGTLFVGYRNLRHSQRSTQETLDQQRSIDERRAQDDALQAYYRQIGDLMTDHGLMTTSKDDPRRKLARAQTLTVLGRLDGSRKRDLVIFLSDAALIKRSQSIVGLKGANLRGANFSNAFLDDADLSATDLSDANLTGAHLNGADLKDATVSDEQLLRCLLNDATIMPDGREYKEWRAQKERQALENGLEAQSHSASGKVSEDRGS